MSQTSHPSSIIKGFDSFEGLAALRDRLESPHEVATFTNQAARDYCDFAAKKAVMLMSVVAARREQLRTGVEDTINHKLAFYQGALLGLKAVEFGSDDQLVQNMGVCIPGEMVEAGRSIAEIYSSNVAHLNRLTDIGGGLTEAVDLPIEDWAMSLTRDDEHKLPVINGLYFSVGLGDLAAKQRAKAFVDANFEAIRAQW